MATISASMKWEAFAPVRDAKARLEVLFVVVLVLEITTVARLPPTVVEVSAAPTKSARFPPT